jgi:hypothetical protein
LHKHAKIAVITVERDFHSYAIRAALARRNVGLSIIESDSLSGKGGFSWSNAADTAGVISDVDGNSVSIRDLQVIWWRRISSQQRAREDASEEATELVANDCRAALTGLLATEFAGKWVSEPEGCA